MAEESGATARDIDLTMDVGGNVLRLKVPVESADDEFELRVGARIREFSIGWKEGLLHLDYEAMLFDEVNEKTPVLTYIKFKVLIL